jgi:hypothetical protein
MNFLASGGARRPRWSAATLATLIGFAVGACTFDPDERCSSHQTIYGDNNRCVCEEGAVLTAAGCVPCGEHEVPGNGECVCESGYTRALDGVACEPAPEALGTACSADKPCTDATFSHCQSTADQTGYCTNIGCTSSSECSGGYACDTSAQPSVCKRPPTGLGKSCATESDCAGGEASFCDTVQSHSCLVANCSLDPDDCFEGWTCTDLSMFGMPIPLCLPKGAL